MNIKLPNGDTADAIVVAVSQIAGAHQGIEFIIRVETGDGKVVEYVVDGIIDEKTPGEFIRSNMPVTQDAGLYFRGVRRDIFNERQQGLRDEWR